MLGAWLPCCGRPGSFGRGGTDQFRTAIFLTLVFSSKITRYVVRTALAAWKDRPSSLLVAGSAPDVPAASALALCGVMMASISGALLLLIAALTLAGGFIADRLKVPAFRKLRLHTGRAG